MSLKFKARPDGFDRTGSKLSFAAKDSIFREREMEFFVVGAGPRLPRYKEGGIEAGGKPVKPQFLFFES